MSSTLFEPHDVEVQVAGFTGVCVRVLLSNTKHLFSLNDFPWYSREMVDHRSISIVRLHLHRIESKSQAQSLSTEKTRKEKNAMAGLLV